METPGSILSLRNATIGFHSAKENIKLAEGINLKLNAGELIGLIGRNGSGKSTLLRSLVRLLELLEGEIYIGNREISKIHPNDFAREIAFVSSGVEHADAMTVTELVNLGRFPYTNWIGKLNSHDKKLVDNAIRSVGIEKYANTRLGELSDGERQKAMIARTLAQDSPIIILDEPTAFLDLPSKYDIISLLYDLTRKGKTVIYSTHDLNISLRFSDQLWLIDQNIIHHGSPEDLVLDKTISRIFESEKIHLNEMTGDFELRKKYNKSICLACEIPGIAYWTKQALQRAGYEIVRNSNSHPLVSAEVHNNKVEWKLQLNNNSGIFNSLFELLSFLAQNSPEK